MSTDRGRNGETDLVPEVAPPEVGHPKMALRSFSEGQGKGRNPPPHHERYVNYAIIAIYCARPIGKDYCRQLLCLLISCSQEQTNHAADTNPCLLPHS